MGAQGWQIHIAIARIPPVINGMMCARFETARFIRQGPASNDLFSDQTIHSRKLEQNKNICQGAFMNWPMAGQTSQRLCRLVALGAGHVVNQTVLAPEFSVTDEKGGSIQAKAKKDQSDVR
jgi:hypothetical protein